MQCPKCDSDHGEVRLLVVERRTLPGRPLEKLPDMTVAEFEAAYPDHDTLVDERTYPPTIQFLAPGDDRTQVIFAGTRDEYLHPASYPMRSGRPDREWVTVGGLIDVNRAAAEHEATLATPLARLFARRQSPCEVDPLVLDALLRPVDAALADTIRDRVAARPEALIRRAVLQKSEDPDPADVAQVEQIITLANTPPFPVREGDSYRFSDGSVRTAESFAVEANDAARKARKL